MLLRRGKSEKRESYLQVLERETDRLTNIIEDLLDLSSLDTGRIPSQLEPIESGAVVQRVFDSSITQAITNDVILSIDVDDDLPMVIADAGQLEQLLSNLVVNALNYTEAGDNVTISARSDLHNGEPAVCFSVSDNGPGIAAEEIPHLFDRFYRGQAAQDSNAPGTGLGLTICREIVEIHGGTINVESQLGEGTKFIVHIPSTNERQRDHRQVDVALGTPAGD
jgi:signal transduction histidine kinase